MIVKIQSCQSGLDKKRKRRSVVGFLGGADHDIMFLYIQNF